MTTLLRAFVRLWILTHVLLAPAYAVTLKANEPQQYSGVVTARGWAKSGESYCQGGSEYYVLVTDTGREVTLNSNRDPINKKDHYKSFRKIQAELKTLVGQTVTVEGSLVAASWEQDEHCPPESQCLMGTLSCTWLRVLKITAKERTP